MLRFLASLLVGVLLGLGAGIYGGWVVFPVEFTDSAAPALEQTYKDEFTVMIADGYRADTDITSALERLRLLQEENIPLYVQNTTERYISNSRDIDDIRALVTLSEALGRLTPIMEPYRTVSLPNTGGN